MYSALAGKLHRAPSDRRTIDPSPFSLQSLCISVSHKFYFHFARSAFEVCASLLASLRVQKQRARGPSSEVTILIAIHSIAREIVLFCLFNQFLLDCSIAPLFEEEALPATRFNKPLFLSKVEGGKMKCAGGAFLLCASNKINKTKLLRSERKVQRTEFHFVLNR